MADNDIPKYPYVKFGCLRKHTKNMQEDHVPEVYYLNVRGCHGAIANLEEIARRGHKVLGCGNLNMNVPKHIDIQRFVNQQTGANIDPRVQALATDVMTAKVEEKRRELKR